jgi:RinA family phage transcriptional activator
MTVIEITKPTFKKVESEWFNFYDTKKEINLLEEVIMNPTKEEDDNAGGGRSNSNTSPTERIATRLSTHKQLNYLREVHDAVQRVYNALEDDYQKLVRLRYWNKNNRLTWDGIALELNVSKRHAMRWRDEIIHATAEVLGWR